MLCERQSGSFTSPFGKLILRSASRNRALLWTQLCLGTSSLPCPLRLSLAFSTFRSYRDVCAQLSGQFAVPFQPVTNAIGLDPRVTSWVPNLPDGGLFGGPGNGGNLGKK